MLSICACTICTLCLIPIIGLTTEIKNEVFTKETNLSSSWLVMGSLAVLRKKKANNMNLLFIQYYSMQSPFKCLQEKTLQFEEQKCRMTFAVEVNASVDLLESVSLGLWHLKTDAFSEKKEEWSNIQDLQQVSKGSTHDTEWMWQTGCKPAAALSRPSAAFATLAVLTQSHHRWSRPWFHAHPKQFSSTVTEWLI